MSKLPTSILSFVEQLQTKPIADLLKDPESESPYGAWYCRAVAAMLLSGRVNPKDDGSPNMTDVNRICKEANFNQYECERIGKFLVACDVIEPNHVKDKYLKGRNHDPFWAHRDEPLTEITRSAFLRLLGQKPCMPVDDLGLVELLRLFFHCLDGLAVPEAHFGKVLQEFCSLPGDDLVTAARSIRLAMREKTGGSWQAWLDSKRQEAIIKTLYHCGWAYSAEHGNEEWIMPSPVGRAMIGLGRTPRRPSLLSDIKVQSDNSVFAGAGLQVEKLAMLCRYSIIKQCGQMFEFRLDRRRIAEASTTASPATELKSVLDGAGKLPATVRALLDAKPLASGVVAIRACSALVKSESPEGLQAIRTHPKLKGYIEPGAPPGYLLIKSRSDPSNFVRRCRELGFEVRLM